MANFWSAAHLAAAMTAVLAQTERRLELIVADDASEDDSVAIARRIAATDDRVRVIASPSNGGPAITRNLALDAARGEAPASDASAWAVWMARATHRAASLTE